MSLAALADKPHQQLHALDEHCKGVVAGYLHQSTHQSAKHYLPLATAPLKCWANSIAPPLLNVTLNVPLPCQPPKDNMIIAQYVLHINIAATACYSNKYQYTT